MNTGTTTLLAAMWLAYFALHSALASMRVKSWFARRFPRVIPSYRLAYNAFAAAALLPILWLMYRHPGPALWAWNGPEAWLANALALAAVGGFVLSARYYDTAEFSGVRQLTTRTAGIEDQEGFRISPFHRHVRHPWYFFGLVVLWTRDMNAALLVSAVMITAYLFIGAHLEEKKLIARFGTAYRTYMRRVPGLVPLPGRSITAQEAEKLVALSRRESPPKQ